MEVLAWAFLGGIVGAVLMDVTETYATKLSITSGVNIPRGSNALLASTLSHLPYGLGVGATLTLAN